MNLNTQLLTTLQTRFKLASFRPGQQEAITTLLEKGRLLCIQPTGHGKSLLYQLPATLLEGITLVISPLLALMRDQIQQLNQRFGIPAASMNSDQSAAENGALRWEARQGQFKILFVAPEKLDNVDYFNFLLELPLSLVVVDEAHCISTWGHDFRPSYRQILHFIAAAEQKNSDLKILGITATANQKTEEDIAQQLQQNGKHLIVHRHNMDRANIQLTTLKLQGTPEKLLATQQLLQQLEGTGLIYCATRDNTELVAHYLQGQGFKIAAYHAGFSPAEKIALQQDFIDNKYQAIAATNALGMGIDKQDLRYIIHFDMPGSITAYYQEVGRCGRDGSPARGLLLFDDSDKKIQQYFINSAQPTTDDFKTILALIKTEKTPPNLAIIRTLSGLHPTRVTVILAELLEQAYITKTSQAGKQVYLATKKSGIPDLSRYATQLMLRTLDLNEMLNYGEQTERCLMASLRMHLGDTQVHACGHCSVCAPIPLHLACKKADITRVHAWLNERTTAISLGRTTNVHPGIALLDGKLRTPLFIEFMRARAHTETPSEELIELIKTHLGHLKTKYSISAVICLPSRTWQARAAIAQLIAHYLKVPLFLDHLQWREEPNARQGELLNNDQRSSNVSNKMVLSEKIKAPLGHSLLLVDDYLGSGATMKEAIRVLQKLGHLTQDILPFTLAAVKWRLGHKGMV